MIYLQCSSVGCDQHLQISGVLVALRSGPSPFGLTFGRARYHQMSIWSRSGEGRKTGALVALPGSCLALPVSIHGTNVAKSNRGFELLVRGRKKQAYGGQEDVLR